MIGLFLRHPVAPNLLVALMILAGMVALDARNRQYFPNVSPAPVTVDRNWAGAGAEHAAHRITIPVHEELRTFDGLDEITSTTVDGRSAMRLKFREPTDVNDAVAGIRDRPGAMRSLHESEHRDLYRLLGPGTRACAAAASMSTGTGIGTVLDLMPGTIRNTIVE